MEVPTGSGLPENQEPVWRARVLEALRALGRPSDQEAVAQQVAARFADSFAAADYVYRGVEPGWRNAVRTALARLVHDGEVTESAGHRFVLAEESHPAPPPVGPDPTGPDPTGPDPTTGAEPPTALPPSAVNEPAAPGEPEPGQGGRAGLPTVMSGVISTPLRTENGRACAGVDDDEPAVLIELNLRHEGGPRAALRALRKLWPRVTGEPGPEPLSDEYATGRLSMDELKRLVAADSTAPPERRAIYRVWPDFAVRKLIDATAVTVKATPAQRSFNAFGDGVVWAVIDSGIDASHPHFSTHATLTDPAVASLHRSFLPAATGSGPDAGTAGRPDDPLTDEDGHGTHVAGIIAGGLRGSDLTDDQVYVTQSVYNVENPDEPLRAPRTVADPRNVLNGMAPHAKLVSLKVLGGGGSRHNRVSRVIAALAYVREVNAASDRLPRIHGVNLSLGYDFDPNWFACGQSPLCLEVDKLVRSGVVVVVAAGNSGYGTLSPTLSSVTQFAMGMTINDPGNAERAITVGATHRDAPHRYGVSYFSSKGPTGDGRAKPDLVAPGERVVSAAAGQYLAAVSVPDGVRAVYVEDTGTSMAAPHVSGAIAAFLSVNREFVGRPEQVKRVFMDSATSLGRDRCFEGAGLVDVMRALQSV